MGSVTLAILQSDLQGAIQRQGLDAALMNRWINGAIREFAYSLKFHELEGLKTFSTVSGQASYTITGDLAVADFRAIHELGIRKTAPDDRLGRIIPEARERYLRAIGDTSDSTTRGDPRFFHKYAGSLYLRPIPDATLVTAGLHYWKKITPLINANDVSQFDEDWDEVILVGAIYRGFRYYGEYDRYQNVRNDFIGLIRSRTQESDLEPFPEGAIQPVGPDDDEGVLESGEI